MRPIIYKGNVYLPLPSKVEDVPAGDLFGKKVNQRTTFRVLERAEKEIKCSTPSGQTIWFSRGWAVIHFSNQTIKTQNNGETLQ